MMIIVSALLALLEASRFHEIQRLTQLQTEVALESVFAKYNTDLWSEYHILACREDTLKEGMVDGGNGRMEDKGAGSNFLQFYVSLVDIEENLRLTDNNGRVFFQAAAGYMEENLIFETAKELYSRYEGIKSLQEGSGFDFSSIKKALDALNEENSQISTGSTGESSLVDYEKENRISVKYNLLEDIQEIQKRGLLSLVIEDINQLSEKTLELSQVVSHRILPENNEWTSEEGDWYTRILFQQYVLKHMSCYTKQNVHALDYEIEYIIGGKDTDYENLKVVVNQLLAMREAANFAYLMSCPSKIEAANVVALSIVGGTLNPMLVGMVKLAVLAAWAFAESILDIRTLLTGGQIVLLKGDGNWTLDLDDVTNLGTDYIKAKNCANGLTYEEYLGILLLFKEETQMAKRTMDMQELTLRTVYNREDMHFEDWMVEADVEFTYRYSPIFFSIQNMIPNFYYEMSVRERFSYD